MHIILIFSVDSKKFEAWLEEVCKALPPKSCLVMDNASYHSKLVSNPFIPFFKLAVMIQTIFFVLYLG